MKKLLSLTALSLLIAGAQAQTQTTPSVDSKTAVIVKDSASLQWSPTPDLPKGAVVSILDGDPSKAERFTVRLKMPANYRVPVHTHSSAEELTFISGELLVASGNKYDQAALKPAAAGTFMIIPANVAHYAFSKTESILQVSAVGPWDIKYMNPDEDPRAKAPVAAGNE